MISIHGYRNFKLLHQTDEVEIYRAIKISSGQDVAIRVSRTSATDRDRKRYLDQYNLLMEIDSEDVVKAFGIEETASSPALVLEYFGGIRLSPDLFRGSDAIDRFLDVAIRLSRVVAKVHAARIVHGDIKPSNILIDEETQKIKLIDFSISRKLGPGEQFFVADGTLIGSLPYLSPEQTGRMERGVDYRSDLYSLGATLYELICGRPPFVADQPLELVHAHLARTPTSPSKVRTDIPNAISNLIMKLLEKEPEQRYQSAEGLTADLERCAIELVERGEIEEFELSTMDTVRNLVLPQHLYGRRNEIAALEKYLESSLRGGRGFTLVYGPPGCGKTAIVSALKTILHEKQITAVDGKFEQHRQHIPYSAFIQAFTMLIQRLLAMSDDQLSAEASSLREKLGGVAGVVCELVPELALIVGDQPVLEQLESSEARNRFLLAMRRFVSTLCSEDQPLVLCLDDLQWADSGSLMLLEDMLTAGATQGLFIVGTYRDDEVEIDHPFGELIEKLASQKVDVSQLRLPALQMDALNSLVADALGNTPEAVRGLCEIIFKKTDGNPFFVRQLLHHLAANKLIAWQAGKGWQWDEKSINGAEIPDDLAEMMMAKLSQLPEDLIRLLQIASCIGSQFSTTLLGDLSTVATDSLTSKLGQLAVQGFVAPTGDGFRFSHNRIHETATALVDPDAQAEFHYRIYRHILNHSDEEAIVDNIFVIADHLLSAQPLLTEQAERERATQVCLRAVQRAMESAAYDPARRYIAAGIDLLSQDADAWQQHYRAMFRLHIAAAECAFQSGDAVRAKSLFRDLLTRELPIRDRAETVTKQMTLFVIEGAPKEATKLAVEELRRLGVRLPLKGSIVNMVSNAIRTQLALRGKRGEDFVPLPESTDPDDLAAFEILYALGPPAYLSDDKLMAAQHMVHIRRILRAGIHPKAGYMLANHALVLAGILDKPIAGREFGEAAGKLNQRLSETRSALRTEFILHTTVYHWCRPQWESLAALTELVARFPEEGDFEFASFSLSNLLSTKLILGKNLKLLEKDLITAASEIDAWGSSDFSLLCRCLARTVGFLTGTNAESLDEDDPLHTSQLQNSNVKMVYPYLISQGMGPLYMRGRAALAYDLSCRVVKSVDAALTSTSQLAEYAFHRGLCAAELAQSAENKYRSDLLKVAHQQHRRLVRWARHAPHNYQHKADLLAAEQARCAGKNDDAHTLYARAANGAAAGGYIQLHALANERRASLALHDNQKADAAIYLSEARRLYMNWGAEAKVTDLEDQYPDLSVLPTATTEERASQSITVTSTKGGTTTRMLESLDIRTVLKASQAIAEELDLTGVVKQVMASAIENAGATRGLLIKYTDGEMFVAGEQRDNGVFTAHSSPVDRFEGIPLSVIRQVARSLETVVISDASSDTRTRSDTCVSANGVLSMFVLPVIRHGIPVGVLYLENDLVRKAFTKDRVEILNLLSGQMATSLENARLYAELNEINRTLEQRVAERTKSLEKAHKELVDLAHQAGKAEIATDVLHNVGNVLSSVNTATGLLSERIRNSSTVGLPKAVALMTKNRDDLARFITRDPKGKMLPEYFERLAKQTEKERSSLKESVADLAKHIEHIKAIISMQQNYAKMVGLIQQTSLSETIDDAIRVNQAGFIRHEAELETQIDELPPIQTDRHKVLQILVNLLSNAKYAVSASETKDKRIRVRLYQPDEQHARIEIEDNGVGIHPENKEKLFTYGFTTKHAGHGFGLHSSANAAKQLGATLSAHSDGVERGAIFALELPIHAFSHEMVNSSAPVQIIPGPTN